MLKLLLIDDDPDVRMVMGRLLEREGYQVSTAANREEAMACLSVEKPALILLDVLLSGADGRDLCRELKEASATRDIPVVMLSGHPVAAQQFESYGASDFVSKPLNTKTLLEKLARLCPVTK